MVKHKLRKEFISIRNNIEATEYSALFAKRLSENLPELGSRIASYYSINSEADISLFNLDLIDSGKKLFLPCADYKFRKWHPDCEMAEGKFPEPQNTEEIELENLDLIIVPLVAFDENKNRLGYGGGYYDRILKDVNCQKIGVAYEAQKTNDIPHEDHDIKLDMILTEANIYK